MNRRKRSGQQERRLADQLGGRTTPGSGSGWATKNDVKTSDVSFEVKFTDKKSFSLKKDELIKAENQALMDGGREFGFIVGFGESTGQGRRRIDREYVLITLAHYESLRRGNSE